VRRKIVWSNRARDEYLAIIRFIAAENPDAAERVADRLDDAVATLSELPTGRAGRVKDTYEKVLSDLPYIIAYEIVAAPGGGEMVAILHVIHGARDWPPGKWPAG
jgi:toxin ParE1/3/4